MNGAAIIGSIKALNRKYAPPKLPNSIWGIFNIFSIEQLGSMIFMRLTGTLYPPDADETAKILVEHPLKKSASDRVCFLHVYTLAQ